MSKKNPLAAATCAFVPAGANGALAFTPSSPLTNVRYISKWSSIPFMTENGRWNKTLRYGRMIDHILASGGIGTLAANTDNTMFTVPGIPDDAPAVSRPVVESSGKCQGSVFFANNLKLYSDGWANVAVLF